MQVNIQMGSLLFHSKMLKYNKIDKSCPKSANKKEMSLITPIKVLLWNIIHFSFASVLQLINTYAIAGWLCGFFSLHLIKFGLLAILPRSPQFGLSLFRCLLSLHLYLACFRISKKQQIYKICIINNIVLISLSTYIWIVQHYTTKKNIIHIAWLHKPFSSLSCLKRTKTEKMRDKYYTLSDAKSSISQILTSFFWGFFVLLCCLRLLSYDIG